MTDHHPDEPYFGFNFDFKRDVLWPDLFSIGLCIMLGLLIIYMPGWITPPWSAVPFTIGFLLVIRIIWAYQHSHFKKR